MSKHLIARDIAPNYIGCARIDLVDNPLAWDDRYSRESIIWNNIGHDEKAKYVGKILKQHYLAVLGLPEHSSWDDIDAESLKRQVIEFGLPEGSTWDDIKEYKYQQPRREKAIRLGLPENTSWYDIEQFEHKESLKRQAIELGLPGDATSEEIFNRRMELERLVIRRDSPAGAAEDSTKAYGSFNPVGERAVELGLSEGQYTMSDFFAKDLERRVAFLGLPQNSTWSDVLALEEAARLKEEIDELGLPPGSTLSDVNNCREMQQMRKVREMYNNA